MSLKLIDINIKEQWTEGSSSSGSLRGKIRGCWVKKQKNTRTRPKQNKNTKNLNTVTFEKFNVLPGRHWTLRSSPAGSFSSNIVYCSIPHLNNLVYTESVQRNSLFFSSSEISLFQPNRLALNNFQGWAPSRGERESPAMSRSHPIKGVPTLFFFFVCSLYEAEWSILLSSLTAFIIFILYNVWEPKELL